MFTTAHIGNGLQQGEVELPNDASGSSAAFQPNLYPLLMHIASHPAATPSLPQFNEAAMAQLEGMGFPTVRCQKALLATGNSDAEVAMEWLFAHMDDAG